MWSRYLNVTDRQTALCLASRGNKEISTWNNMVRPRVRFLDSSNSGIHQISWRLRVCRLTYRPTATGVRRGHYDHAAESYFRCWSVYFYEFAFFRCTCKSKVVRLVSGRVKRSSKTHLLSFWMPDNGQHARCRGFSSVDTRSVARFFVWPGLRNRNDHRPSHHPHAPVT